MEYNMTEQDKKEFEEWLDSKYKKKNFRFNIDMALEDIDEEIEEELSVLWKKHCQSFGFNTSEDYEAYGDTYVSSGKYITDESDQECREKFTQDVTADDLIDALRANPMFRKALNNIIDTWAYNTELEV